MIELMVKRAAVAVEDFARRGIRTGGDTGHCWVYASGAVLGGVLLDRPPVGGARAQHAIEVHLGIVRGAAVHVTGDTINSTLAAQTTDVCMVEGVLQGRSPLNRHVTTLVACDVKTYMVFDTRIRSGVMVVTPFQQEQWVQQFEPGSIQLYPVTSFPKQEKKIDATIRFLVFDSA